MKPKPNVIGISGVAGSGKDTFANLIGCKLKELNAKVKFLSFAERLKWEVKDVSSKLYDIDPTNCSRDDSVFFIIHFLPLSTLRGLSNCPFHRG